MPHTAIIPKNKDRIADSVGAFIGRSEFETIFGETFASLDGLHDAQKRLARWMRPRRRSIDLMAWMKSRSDRNSI